MNVLLPCDITDRAGEMAVSCSHVALTCGSKVAAPPLESRGIHSLEVYKYHFHLHPIGQNLVIWPCKVQCKLGNVVSVWAAI